MKTRKSDGDVDTEMVMRTYGKWIPDDSAKKGHQPVNDWGGYIDKKKVNKPAENP